MKCPKTDSIFLLDKPLRLSEIQENDLKQKKKILIQDVAIHWNSTFYMLQQLYEQKNSISLHAT